ncbi:MAG TPA: inositol monophosphatase family protein [Stellaceae bacterium]|nr:inositol monophosphatase family protein [Stellaceae bacterium]
MGPDFDRVEAAIREVAAVEILPRFQKLSAADMHEKQPGQLVTIADTEAERRLTPMLESLMPGSVVVGEEGVAEDAARLGWVASEPLVWLVDPVDGTQNFAESKPVFATMVALLRGGHAVAGWIYDPVSGRMAMAEEGSGAFLDDARLKTAAAVPLPRMRGRLTSRAAKRIGDRVGPHFYFRCAGHEYVALARGDAEFGLFRRLYPWDHAPGELLFREAGGFSARLDGSSYQPSEVEASLLLAPDRESWAALRALVLELAT